MLSNRCRSINHHFNHIKFLLYEVLHKYIAYYLYDAETVVFRILFLKKCVSVANIPEPAPVK